MLPMLLINNKYSATMSMKANRRNASSHRPAQLPSRYLTQFYFIAISVASIHLTEGKTFKYTSGSDQYAFGPNEWSEVTEEGYHYDWSLLDIPGVLKLKGNQCGDDRRPSPIDLGNSPGECLEDDHRMRSYRFGTCTWDDVEFRITPQELRMDFKITDPTNPWRKPCSKPRLDISGGYGTDFRAMTVIVKTPSEHIINKIRYDAEIVIAHIGMEETDEILLFTSTLCKAQDRYPDNPNLEPYISQWENAHKLTLRNCYDKFGYAPHLDLADPPTNSPSSQPTTTSAPTPSPSDAPSVAPTESFSPSVSPSQSPTENCVTGQVSTDLTKDGKDTQGIMFDVEAISRRNDSRSLVVQAFEINIENSGKKTVKVYSKRGSHLGFENDSNSWTDLGEYDIEGKGKGKATLVSLRTGVPLANPGTKQAFYIVQIDDDDEDIQVYDDDDSGKVASLQSSDDTLAIYVGTSLRRGPFESKNDHSRGFSGTILYGICHSADFDAWPTATPTMSAPPSVVPSSAPSSYCQSGQVSAGFFRTEEKTTEIQGIMFDVQSQATSHLLTIESLELNIKKRGTHAVQVYTKSGTHVGFENNDMAWTPLFPADMDEGYKVKGRGIDVSTHLDLPNNITLLPGATQAFFVVQTNDDDIQAYDKGYTNSSDHAFDENLKITVGTGKKGKVFSADSKPGLGFNGAINYSRCPNDGTRRLDKYRSDFEEISKYPYMDIYRLHTSPWYYKYKGSMTMPPCKDGIRWRLLDTPLRISPNQLERITKLLRDYRDPVTCKLSTLGIVSNQGQVNVARPLQTKSIDHELQYCGPSFFGSDHFFETPHGNTGWEMIPDEDRNHDFSIHI